MESKRKKWTPQENVTESLLKFREKRKWQLALRRYILEKNISHMYAPYFGLDIENYRKWIELQFTNGLSWENFGSFWQFDHVVPIACFDFSTKEDLQLCWNFINIRVEKIEFEKATDKKIDLLAVKPYFEQLYNKTGYSLCIKMVEKIKSIEYSNIISEPLLEDFIIKNKVKFEQIATLTSEELTRVNKGTSLDNILLEREIVRKFG